MPTLWLDVEDLFDYAASAARPSGIQRLSHEMFRALRERGEVRFVRHDPVRRTFRIVPWQAVAEIFARLAEAPAARPAAPAAGITAESPGRRRLRHMVYRLPPDVRQQLLATARLQAQAWAALAGLLVFSARATVAVVRRPADTPSAEPAGDFAALVRPGDVLAALGAPWRYPGYGSLIADTKRRHGVKFAFLVYDIIPLRRPEWFDPGLARAFRAWFSAVLPLADAVFAISDFTAADVTRFAAESFIPLAAPVAAIPIGSGFAAVPAVASARLPPPGFALFVSTIEARKNHAMLVRVWRRMLDERPADHVPDLVFAGRLGWLVEDLMQQLRNTGHLGGKIRIIEDPSDAELATLYERCAFTLFPSFYEGFGLPVTESLLFGKPCFAARATSLPQAGGRLARYFDPDSATDAYAAIRAVLDDPDSLRAWQAEIVRDFVPVPWTATADAIVRHLGIG